jgi:hypothetical protein
MTCLSANAVPSNTARVKSSCFVSSDIPTAISQLNAEGQATDVVARRYFTADGCEVAQPQRGITIVKSVMSDGSVKSVKILK